MNRKDIEGKEFEKKENSTLISEIKEFVIKFLKEPDGSNKLMLSVHFWIGNLTGRC